jgi:hypothetical protein
MPSCSNSSNIQSTINTISVTQGGSRLLVSIPFVSGLTLGQVVRYDVATSGYTAAKADKAETSEVFGVIESYDSTTNKLNTVIYGSVNIDSSKLADMGSGGGSGGNDIYFLSGTTAGVLQNLAPTDLQHVVKPVYQISPHGSYSGVVVNYLGYKIGGDIQASFQDLNSLGSLQTLVGNSGFEDSFLDASISHELPIADYPEFYSRFSTSYGYVERITVSESISGAVQSNQVVTQTNSSYTGTVLSVDYANKYVYITRKPNASLASTNKQISIATSSTTNVKLTPTNTQVYSVYTPVISLTQPIAVYGKDGSNVTVSQRVKVGIKVKPLSVQVAVPETVTASSITATELKYGSTEEDLETKINNFESRIAAIETRLKM